MRGGACFESAELDLPRVVPVHSVGRPERVHDLLELGGISRVRQQCSLRVGRLGWEGASHVRLLFNSNFFDFVYVDECHTLVGAECTSWGQSLGVLSGTQGLGLSYESSTSHLLIRFTSDHVITAAGFTATVSVKPGCVPCKTGTYQAASNALECTACPTNAVSAEGSTALSSCKCSAGYTGDAGVGEDCVACEAGTFKDVTGSATCTVCTTNSVSAEGGGSCECAPNFEGDAGGGTVCVACEVGTFKSHSGLGTCTAPTGVKTRAWVDSSSSGIFTGGPPARSSFGCAEAGGKMYLFGGYTGGEHLCSVKVSTCVRAHRSSRPEIQLLQLEQWFHFPIAF